MPGSPTLEGVAAAGEGPNAGRLLTRGLLHGRLHQYGAVKWGEQAGQT